MKTTVININLEEFDEYIGRDNDNNIHMLTNNIKPSDIGWLGNPHHMGWCEKCGVSHNRPESIKRFEIDFKYKLNSDIEFRNSVISLKGKRLGCHCKPLACHGDVIVDWIESQSADSIE